MTVSFEENFLTLLDSSIASTKRLADRAMCQFVGLRILMVVGGASIPFWTLMPERWPAALAGVFVAALTGFDTQFQWGQEWQHFRSVQLTLERKKRDYQYRQAALQNGHIFGAIKTADDNFAKLRDEVEELLATDTRSFFSFRITRWRESHKETAKA
jgi:hypothetical protein